MMNELSDEVLEHAISYPQDLSPGNLQALLKELKERRASALLGEAATTEKAASDNEAADFGRRIAKAPAVLCHCCAPVRSLI